MLALASLVLLPSAVVLVLYGFVRGLPGLLGAVVTLVLAALCLWRALGRRRLARWCWSGVAAVMLTVTGVLVVVERREAVGIGLGTVAGLAGGAAGRTALLATRPPRGRHRLRRPVRRPERPVLFVNPRSGDGAANRVGLVEAAHEAGIEVTELTSGDDLTAMARRAAGDGADCLGAAGGDGTLAQVALVCIESDLPFVCVPAGTRNHFALDLGLDRSDPLGALGAFREAYTKRIDVAEVNGRMFLNNVSVGAYGEVVADEHYRDHKLGTALSKLPELIGPHADPLDLQFVDGDGTEHDSAIVLHVSNNPYELSPRPGFGSRPSLSDGRLGVVAVVHAPTLTGPVRIMRWETTRLEVRSSAAIAVGVDGEAVEFDAPLLFTIRPGALEARIPLDAVGVSPAALRPKLSRRTFRRLGALAAGRMPLP